MAEIRHEVEHDMREGERLGHVKPWASKFQNVAVRVAGLFHCGIHAHGKPWAEPVTGDTMEKTLELMAFLREHALGGFEVMALDPTIVKAEKILAWIKLKELEVFTQRDCHHNLRHYFQKVEDLKPGLSALVERYIIRQVNTPKGENGRPSIKYEVSPQIAKAWSGPGEVNK